MLTDTSRHRLCTAGSMLTIQFTENSRRGIFTAFDQNEFLGSLTVSFSGLTALVAEALEVRLGRSAADATRQLLIEAMLFARKSGLSLHYRCPKAKAASVQQSTQLLRSLDTVVSKVA